MQGEAAKIMTKLLKKITKKALYIELCWELLSKGREREKTFLVYEMVSGIVPYHPLIT